MSQCTCHSERQAIPPCCQVRSSDHSLLQHTNGKPPASCVHACHSSSLPLNNNLPLSGCGCHHFHRTHYGCAGCSPGHTHHHTHLPAVASPLIHAHHQVQSPMAIVHPHFQQLDPAPSKPSHYLRSHVSPPTSSAPLQMQIDSLPISASNSVQRYEPSPGQRSNSVSHTDSSPIKSSSHPRLKQSPLSRPHPHRQRHPSGNNRPHPQHREPLFQKENNQSNGLPLELDFSPASAKDCSITTNGRFMLGVATGSSPSASVDEAAAEVPQVAHDDTIYYGIQAEVTLPPANAGPSIPLPAPPTNKTEVARTMTKPSVLNDNDLPVEVDAAPPTTPTTPTDGQGREGRSPILLYRWWFKVMAREMVVLLGYKSQDVDEMKWHSGPVSSRLSPSLLMTRSGQLYHLMGLLNSEEMAVDSPNLSKQVLKKFKKGFPSQWMKILQQRKSSTGSVSKQKSSKEAALQSTSSLPDLSIVKQEKEESKSSSSKAQKEAARSDHARMMTPVMSDTTNTPRSSFVNSLKRSSRGRTLKPASGTIFPHPQSCNDLYSYDWYGNFTGITSVIDLTSDDPLPPSKRSRSIKREPGEKATPKTHSQSFTTTSTVAPPTSCSSAPLPFTRTKRSTKRSKEIVPQPPLASPVKRQVTLHRADWEVEVVCQPVVKTEGTAGGMKLQVKGHPKPKKSSGECDKQVGRHEDQSSESRKKRGQSSHYEHSTFGSVSRREKGEEGTNGSEGNMTHGSHDLSSSPLSEVLLKANMPAVVSEDSEVEPAMPPKTRSQSRRFHSASESSEWAWSASEMSVLDLSMSESGSASKKERKKAVGVGEKEVADQMSEGDLRSLRQIVHSVPALTSNFWEVVSQRLGTGHSAQQCSTAYHQRSNKMKPPLARPKKIEKKVSNDSSQETSQRKRTRLKEDVAIDSVCEVNLLEKKRGRCKPRKYLPPSPSREKDIETVTVNLPEKKSGRGRPRKFHPPSPSREKDVETSVSSLTDWVSGYSPARRRRQEGSRSVIQLTRVLSEPRNELSGSDLRTLKQIVHSVPALTSNFWEVVSQRLGTGHSAQQCSTAYHQQSNKMKPPSARPKKMEKKEKQHHETSITARTGTLKRKRQLRDALAHLDTDYYDDVFDSTPLKKSKKSVKMPESHDDYFEGEVNNPPRMMYTPSVAHTRVGAPSSQTPSLCDYLTTPDLKCGLKRDVADHVIFNAQKAHKASKRSTTSRKLSASKSFICEQKLRNIRTGELTTLRMFEDSDDSSDESDPFDDILTML